MLSAEENRIITQVGKGTPMGELLRRYWHPIAGEAELSENPIKPVRLFGEELVLFKTRSGEVGLVERHCPHRSADLAHGMVEEHGLRCNYHGWCFSKDGIAIDRPFEDEGKKNPARLKLATTYPIQVKSGLIWTYMGPQPAPLLPDWEPFSWENGFVQVIISTVPCNWFQCQENSIDPIHFEWMHENWGSYLQGKQVKAPRHIKIEFDEIDEGFVYRRIKEDTDEDDEIWTTGRVCLWPNGFFLGEHFEWRVPIDDENTLSVTWKYTRVPRESEPYRQDVIPTWQGPVFDESGAWITTHVMNQDFLAWAGQGRVTDRTRELLGKSDRGILMIRKRFFEDIERIKRGEDPKAVLRDPAINSRIPLPVTDRELLTGSFTRDEITLNKRLKLLRTTFFLHAGQPDSVRREFEDAIGLGDSGFRGLMQSR
ncbi:MAG: aromatic ring-hydroxylating dioxygenase subunit alpha [Sphingobium limneticum]